MSFYIHNETYYKIILPKPNYSRLEDVTQIEQFSQMVPTQFTTILMFHLGLHNRDAKCYLRRRL